MKIKKKYEKPLITIKKFIITDCISSSGADKLFIGGHEFRY